MVKTNQHILQGKLDTHAHICVWVGGGGTLHSTCGMLYKNNFTNNELIDGAFKL